MDEVLRVEPSARALLRGREAQPHRELPRSAPGDVAPHQGGARLGGRAGRHAHAHVLRAASRGRARGRGARGPRRRAGRSRRHLHGHGPRGGRRDARVRAHRRHALGHLRRLQLGGAARPHQRLRREGPAHAGRRVAAGQRRAAQEDGRRGRGADAQHREGRRAPAHRRRRGARRDERGPRPLVGRLDRRRADRAEPASARRSPRRSTRSIRSSSSTRRARPASPRASFTRAPGTSPARTSR